MRDPDKHPSDKHRRQIKDRRVLPTGDLKMVIKNISMPERMWDIAESIAEHESCNRSEYFRKLIRADIERYKHLEKEALIR